MTLSTMIPIDPSMSLVPHAVCWASSPRLIWTMVVTNLVTFLSYLTICLTLLFMVRRTGKVIARDWVGFVVGFALFIVACGSTHLLEVITTWSPVFWIDAWTNIITATLSATVAIMLIRRAAKVSFAINDYAARLADSENERRRMEASLLAAQRLEDWSRMSAVIAHEISNPLEAVQGLLHLIRTTPDVSGEVVTLAQTAAAEATRILTISRSTLSFFRETLDSEIVDLGSVAESVRFLIAPMLAHHGTSLTIETGGDVTIEALPGETRQVLLNLLRNACEATTRAGTTIQVRITGKAEHVEVEVIDQGVGISAEALSTLFQFGRSTKGDKGNGLGLWAVRQILHRHGGTIAVASEPGQGARFTLVWPRRCALRAAAAPKQTFADSILLAANED